MVGEKGQNSMAEHLFCIQKPPVSILCISSHKDSQKAIDEKARNPGEMLLTKIWYT